MTRSTAWPACTISITRRGFLSWASNSVGEWVPMMDWPRARPAIKASTLVVVRFVNGNGKTVASHVEDEVFAHHG